MKSTIKNYLLVVLMTIASLKCAQAVTRAKVAGIEDKKSENNEKYQLYIKDMKGQILFQELMNEYDFKIISFNYENLPIGSYQAELVDGFKTQVLPISVLKDTLISHYESMTVHYEPTIVMKNKSVLLNMYSPKKATLLVKIYDEKQHLLYKKNIKGKGNMGASFDFSSLAKGKYTLSLSSRGRDYSKVIEMK